MSADDYEGREQAEAKHLMLGAYLEALAFKIGNFRPGLTLNYVDGFSGPWMSQTDDLRDTSPAIALRHLVAVRAQLAARGRQITVRAFFVSRDPDGALQLERLRAQFPETEIEVAVGRFEDRIEDARRFVRVGRDPFAFIFIDPTGWTGFGLRAIAPLLREGRTEVLLNFMTKDISRFIDHGPAAVEPSFIDLFGDASFREAWRDVSGLDREERMLETYSSRLRDAGAYLHCVSAMILNPKANRTHYHLVYGTHSDAGLVVFREVERRGVELQRARRAEVKQQQRAARHGQEELFDSLSIAGRTYEDELRRRYQSRALARLDALVADHNDVTWEELVVTALQVSMVSEADVKDWLATRLREGRLEVIGLAPRARVPQRGAGHRIRRRP